MSTYTESTGFDVIEVDGTGGYNATPNGGGILWTCPEGHFAVITQMSVRLNISNVSQHWIQFGKRHYGGAIQRTSETQAATVIDSEYRFVFTNLITYNGNQFPVSDDLLSINVGSESERFLVAGEYIAARHQAFTRTAYYHIRIELFTAQV